MNREVKVAWRWVVALTVLGLACLGLARCHDDPPAPTGPRIGGKDTAHPAEPAHAGDSAKTRLANARQPAAPAAPRNTSMVTLLASFEGAAVEGVGFELTALGQQQHVHAGRTGDDGVCRLQIPRGRYHVQATHPAYGLAEAPYLPEKILEVIAETTEVPTSWLPAYACGFLLEGEAPENDAERHRFVVDSSASEIVEAASCEFVERELKKRNLPGHVSITFLRAAPPHRSIVVFDRVRGACRFQLPLRPVADYPGPLTCDLANQPVGEEMAGLEIRIVDALGKPLASSRASVHRSTRYAEAYQADWIQTGRVTWIPPGDYSITLTCPTTGERFSAAGQVLIGGATKRIEWRTRTAMHLVSFAATRSGLLQFSLGGNRHSAPVPMRPQLELEFSMPAGAATVAFTHFDEVAGRHVTTISNFVVDATPTPSRISIP